MEMVESINSMSSTLSALFSDEKVTRDLNHELFSEVKEGGSLLIELDGLTFTLPPDVHHKVCSVVLQYDLISVSKKIRVFCALGGIEQESHGIIDPKYCFALVRYNHEGELYTYDLYTSQFY